MVPAERAKEAVEVMRRLQLDRFTDAISPLQVRWQKADQGYLSAQYGRDTTSLSVSGVVGTSYEPFLRAVDRELQPFDARPHWGKIHFLTPDRVRTIYPRFDDFQAIRRQFDPHGVFMNDHLRQLFAD
jgi:FAD/FMN-containing dehydrogenase